MRAVANRNRRPRVAVVVDSDAWGGAEVYAGHLLRRAYDHGWRPTLVCSRPVAARFRGVVAPAAVSVVPLARHAAAAPACEAALRSRAPDVVLLNLVDPASNAAALRAATSVAPTVATLHLDGDCGSGVARSALRSLYARLDVAISPAAAGAHQLVAELGVPGERVVVVPNGVDVPQAPPGPARHHPPRIGVLGRLTEQKGLDVLLQSLRTLRADGMEVEVVVAGEGRDGARLAAQADGLPVRWCGFVHDVPGFLAGLDVFCLPSRREALPLALLEAMASGLPCVATDVGDVRGTVGDAVVTVPPGDGRRLAEALRRLLRSPEDAAVLGRRAHALVAERMDASLMAARTFAVLRASLAERARARVRG